MSRSSEMIIKSEVIEEFLDTIEIYYEAYYEDEEGFDNSDDLIAVIDLAFKFYEKHRGKINIEKDNDENEVQ